MEPLRCDYAGCDGLGMHVEDGWRFCRWHIKSHRAVKAMDKRRAEGKKDD